MNPFLSTVPFDLYELSLFHLVARHGSFTKAGREAGLTQSAMTRQIRGIEEQLGVALFERTTRNVSLTAAGQLLLEKSAPILRSTESILHELQDSFHLVPRTLRIGVARSIGLAYYPGFFFAFRKTRPDVQLVVVQRTSKEILEALEARELDAGLLCPPAGLPRALTATHRFKDEFAFIVPPDRGDLSEKMTLKNAAKKLGADRWLLLDDVGQTGKQLRAWMKAHGLDAEAAMQLDGFDVIVNLVALGLGVSLVPHRVLPIYANRREVRRISTSPRFVRELAVIVRKSRQQPEHLQAFIDGVLF